MYANNTMPPRIAASTAIVATSATRKPDAQTPARPTTNADMLVRHADNCNVSRCNEARQTYTHYTLVAFDHQTGRARLKSPQGVVHVVTMRTLECNCTDYTVTLRKVANDVVRAGHLEPVLVCKHPHIIHMIVCDEIVAQGVDWSEIDHWHALDLIPNAIKRVFPDLPRFPLLTDKNKEMDWK